MKQPLAHPIPVVRLIVPDPSGRVLILQRGSAEYAPGDWCLPGGKIDYGDTVFEAARRELAEETGLDCRELTFLFYQDSLPVKKSGMHCISFYLECRASGEIILNSESSRYAFIGPEDLSRYPVAFRNDEGLKCYWQKKQHLSPASAETEPSKQE